MSRWSRCAFCDAEKGTPHARACRYAIETHRLATNAVKNAARRYANSQPTHLTMKSSQWQARYDAWVAGWNAAARSARNQGVDAYRGFEDE